jgi:preprotein translocase subunit SecG
MEFWMNLVIFLHVLVAIAIIGLVLLQHGKGADMGSGFGGGTSGSLFGATGSANFLSRTTAILAAVFFLSSLGLAYFATQKPRTGGSVVDSVKTLPDKPAAKAGEGAAKDTPKADPATAVPAPKDAPPAKDPPKAKDVPN